MQCRLSPQTWRGFSGVERFERNLHSDVLLGNLTVLEPTGACKRY